MSIRIGELTEAEDVYDNDKLVIEQNGQAMSLPGSVFRSWLDSKIEGKGGISSIEGPEHRNGKDYYTVYWTRETMTPLEFSITSASVNTYKVDYQAGSSGTTAPTGTWADDLESITVQPGQYLWTRTKIKWNSGAEETSYSVGYHGRNGNGSGTVTSVNGAQPDNSGAVYLSMEPMHYHITASIGPTSSFRSSVEYDDYPWEITIQDNAHAINALSYARVVFPVNAVEIAAPVCKTTATGVVLYFSDKPESTITVNIEHWRYS